MKISWDTKAPLYQRLRQTWPFAIVLDQENRNARRLLRDFEVSGKTIIDVGCGSGNAQHVLPADCRTLSLDFSIGMLERIPNKDIARPACADALHLPVKANACDLVLVIGLLEYVEDKERLMHMLARVLKPGGQLLLTSSPPGMITSMRKIWGAALYPATTKDVIDLAKGAHLTLARNTRSIMQEQFVFVK